MKHRVHLTTGGNVEMTFQDGGAARFAGKLEEGSGWAWDHFGAGVAIEHIAAVEPLPEPLAVKPEEADMVVDFMTGRLRPRKSAPAHLMPEEQDAIRKVRDALEGNGFSPERAGRAINAIQNAGIRFTTR